MKTKTTRLKPWSELTQEERVARVKAGFGKYRGLTGGTKEFQKNKKEEIDLEEDRSVYWAHRRQ